MEYIHINMDKFHYFVDTSIAIRYNLVEQTNVRGYFYEPEYL